MGDDLVRAGWVVDMESAGGTGLCLVRGKLGARSFGVLLSFAVVLLGAGMSLAHAMMPTLSVPAHRLG